MRLSITASALLTACAIGPAADGYRAKVAAGCKTVEACSTLADEGELRWRRCMDQGRGAACGDELRDKFEANALLNRARDASVAGQASSLRASERQVADANDAFEKDAHRLGNSCDDLATLQSGAAAARERRYPRLAARYDDEVTSRRQMRVMGIKSEAEARMRSSGIVGPTDDLDGARQNIATVRDLASGLPCYDADAAAKLSAEVADWAQAREQAITIEAACRASTECLARRYAEPICDAIADRRAAAHDMALERANPSGYVDARELHDLGQRIQDDDAEIAKLKTKYAAIAHRAFAESTCNAAAK